MLRLPKFELREPSTLAEATALLAEHGANALIVAGGTDLVPNMKHRLFEPKVVVSLARIAQLAGVQRATDGALSIGAMTRIADVAAHPAVAETAPALSQAASLIAGPQLRTMGTIGGNVMLDTRCQWYNQTYFWRKALGFCLKKDGTLCHVVESGRKCVAAASNDTAPALMTLDARLEFASAAGTRELAIDDLWRADGIVNKRVRPGEILTRVLVPAPRAGHRGAYGKLRERGSIDFPLFGVAVRLDVDPDGRIADADAACVALAARPLHLKGVADELVGEPADGPDFDAAARRVAARAHKQCRPLENIPGDAAWRHEMVPVYVRRTLAAAAAGTGPVHHLDLRVLAGT